jgi:hypothetical protein
VSLGQFRCSVLDDLTPSPLKKTILGGFVAGLIIPHDNGFAISLVEKFEDLVSIILLPIVRDGFYSIDLHCNVQFRMA